MISFNHAGQKGRVAVRCNLVWLKSLDERYSEEAPLFAEKETAQRRVKPDGAFYFKVKPCFIAASHVVSMRVGSIAPTSLKSHSSSACTTAPAWHA